MGPNQPSAKCDEAGAVDERAETEDSRSSRRNVVGSWGYASTGSALWKLRASPVSAPLHIWAWVFSGNVSR